MPSPPPPSAPPTGLLPGLLAVMARPQTLLLVEDSRFAADAVRLICQRAGIRLRRTETLHGARRHLRFYRPELALVDLGLPDGSGLELIAELAALTQRRPRIVAISGEMDGRAAALAAGADTFCAKPLCLAEHLPAILGVPRPRTDRPAPGEGNPVAPFAPEAEDKASDPMALHDDLKRAHELLCAGGRIDYAGQFVGGIARSLNDRPLIAAADLARSQGRRRPLMAALKRRTAEDPAF